MPLTPEQGEAFRRDGYLALPEFFDAREVAALQAEVARWQREGLVRNVATDGDGKTHSQTKTNLQLIPLFDKSDLMRALPFQDKVVDAVGRLIGDPFVLHLDQMFLKPGRHGAGTSWHQDNAYFKIPEPLRGTAMWVAVHEATRANGTIHVIPGSYREQYEHYRDPGSDHHIRCDPPDEQGREVAIELPPGGVAFFCYGTAHCTKANTTDAERAGLAFHFLHDSQIDQASLLREKPLLSGPDTTGGEAGYGVRVAGTWDAEVEKIFNVA